MKTINPTHIARLLCPALLLLSACTHNEAPDEATNTPVPLQISNVALQATADTHAASTRATTTIASGSIGVFVSNGQTGVANRKYTYAASGKWQADTPIQIGSTTLELCAYHPYNTVASSTTTFELPAQVYSAAQDLSYATVSESTKVTAAAPNALFAMKRAYAQVTLQITRQQGYPKAKPCRITNVAFNRSIGGTMYSMRELNIATGSYGSGLAASTLSFTGLGVVETTGITSEATQNVNLLMPPQSFSADIRVQLTIDNVAHSFTIPRTDMPRWEAGKRYQIAVSINETGVAVTQISLADWVTKEIDGGTTTGKVPAPGYIVVGSLKVAKGNLMRTGTGNNGTWYLAPDQGYYTGKPLGGDYFCWGIVDPTLISDEANENNMAAVSIGCLTALGTGWRMPTKEDFEALVKSPIAWGTYQSERGSVSGLYFGVSTSPSVANQDDYLFLPATGYRDGGGSMVATDAGAYWTTTLEGQYPVSAGIGMGAVGAYLDFETKEKTQGRALRCVANVTP